MKSRGKRIGDFFLVYRYKDESSELSGVWGKKLSESDEKNETDE
jgi:hypothetical protein